MTSFDELIFKLIVSFNQKYCNNSRFCAQFLWSCQFGAHNCTICCSNNLDWADSLFAVLYTVHNYPKNVMFTTTLVIPACTMQPTSPQLQLHLAINISHFCPIFDSCYYLIEQTSQVRLCLHGSIKVQSKNSSHQ